ncbi:MAG: LacI family transcriptional regulator [Phycisphaeraceae bacterium]|nr:LacI family transcriptional regulator [Phycisphaeraceae bacterium]
MIKTDVNIKDVASLAGVSTGTVSRVLRGEAGVRPVNANRVRQAVQELGYTLRGKRPLGSGRAPRSRKTGNIGIYISRASAQWANHPMYAAFFQGLSRACNETGFHYLTEFGENEDNMPRMVTENKIDGLLVKGMLTPSIEKLSTRLPIVGLNLNQPGLSIDQVNCDDYHSGYSAAQYLWEMGHRRIAFVSNISHHPMLLMRYQGYERFLRMNHAFDPEIVFLRATELVGPSLPETEYPQFDEMLQQWWQLPADQRPTAVLCANDWNAAGCYQSAQRLGIRIPDDLSVLAFDNTVELCSLLTPQLSSYTVAQELCTYQAAMRLIQRIDQDMDNQPSIVQSVVGELVERESVRQLQVK